MKHFWSKNKDLLDSNETIAFKILKDECKRASDIH